VKRLDNGRAAGPIVPHSTDRNGRALYRVGDVEDVLLSLGQHTAKPIRGGKRRQPAPTGANRRQPAQESYYD
jgi:hypothetical protein